MVRLVVLAAMLVALLGISVASAANIAYNFDVNTVVPTDAGYEIINGHAANLTIVVTTNTSKPFTASSFSDPANTTISVTVEFHNSLGQVLDVTGDGIEDTFVATENSTSPGTYEVSINTSAQPGEYTLYIHAVATDSNTGTVLDEGYLEATVWIADEYWVTVWAKENERVTIGALSFEIDTFNDRGAVVILNNELKTLSPDSNGIVATQVDIDGDGVATDWMILKRGEELTEIRFFSKNNILPAELSDNVTVSEMTVTRDAWLKNNDNYRQIILWDQSPLAWIKAVDYYIIPAKGAENWREGQGSGYSGKVTIVQRTTWFNLFATDKKIYEGNIFGKSVGDEILNLFGRWAGNKASFSWGWEVAQGIARLTYPTDYELRFRNAAIPSELDFRAKFVLPFGDGIDWEALVAGR